MKAWTRMLLSCCFLAALVGVGCTQVKPDDGVTSKAGLMDFMPLAVGNQWIYSTFYQEQSQADLSVKIVSEENGYFIDDRPKPGRLIFDRVGLRDGDKRYLLKTPLSTGTKWMSVTDVNTVEHYEIVGVAKKVRVPAGIFEDCITVRLVVKMTESRSMRNEMTFAPGVGIVEIRTILVDGNKVSPQSKLVLKSFTLTPSRKAEKS